MTDVVTEDINIFDTGHPACRTPTRGPSASSGTIGSDMVVEVRYVGTRSRENWDTLNYNERNIIENGFLNEFRQAQANLQAQHRRRAAAEHVRLHGRVPGTGAAADDLRLSSTATTGSANNSAYYTSATGRTTTFLTPLATCNPNPLGCFATATNLD